MPTSPTIHTPAQLLGVNIRMAREDAKLTQLELAHRLGYRGRNAGAKISRVESGEQEPRLEKIIRIARELRVPVEQLLPR